MEGREIIAVQTLARVSGPRDYRRTFPVCLGVANYTEMATMVMLASYESSQYCAGVVPVYCGNRHFHLGCREFI